MTTEPSTPVRLNSRAHCRQTHCICCSWFCTSLGRDSKVEARVNGTCCCACCAGCCPNRDGCGVCPKAVVVPAPRAGVLLKLKAGVLLAPKAGVLLAPKAGVLDAKLKPPPVDAPKAGVLLAPKAGVLLAPKAGVLLAPKAGVLPWPKLKPVLVWGWPNMLGLASDQRAAAAAALIQSESKANAQRGTCNW